MNFSDFRHLKTLIYYDMPLLDLFEYNDKPMLVCWCDISDDHKTDTYFVFDATPENLEAYVATSLSLRALMEAADKMWTMVYDGHPAKFTPLLFANIPEDMRPTTDSYYCEEFS